MMNTKTDGGKASSDTGNSASKHEIINVLCLDYDGCCDHLMGLFIENSYEYNRLKYLPPKWSPEQGETLSSKVRRETLRYLSRTPTVNAEPFDVIIPASLRVSFESDLGHQRGYQKDEGLRANDCRLFSEDLTTLEQLLNENGIDLPRIDRTTILDIKNALQYKISLTTLEAKALENKTSNEDITVDDSKAFMWMLQAQLYRKKYPNKNINLYVYDDSLREDEYGEKHAVIIGAQFLRDYPHLLPQGVTIHFYSLDGYQLFNEKNYYTNQVRRLSRNPNGKYSVIADMVEKKFSIKGTGNEMSVEMLKIVAEAALPKEHVKNTIESHQSWLADFTVFCTSRSAATNYVNTLFQGVITEIVSNKVRKEQLGKSVTFANHAGLKK